ncbi:AAA family ATPase, partial [Oceaniovalibus sp. ACAM 378]
MLRDGLGCHVPEIDLTRLTSAAAGASAADIDGALRVARTHARQRGRAVEPVDLLTQFGFEDRNPALDSRIAVHECGHAIVFKYLGLGRVRRLAITRDGGGAWLHSTPQQGLISDWESQITYILAGRAAERLIFGAATAGAGGGETSDLAQATAQAVLIDTKLGLGAEGLVWLDPDRSLYLQDPENAARVRSRLDKAESRALVVLVQNEPLLRQMADALNQARML